MISLLDALQITENNLVPFGIKFVTFDKTRKSGGQIIELTEAVKVGASHNMKANDTISVKQLGNTNHPYTVHTHLIMEINKQHIFM